MLSTVLQKSPVDTRQLLPQYVYSGNEKHLKYCRRIIEGSYLINEGHNQNEIISSLVNSLNDIWKMMIFISLKGVLKNLLV